jgi:kinesin family protein C2/C3
MDEVASSSLSKQPSEEQFCLALRNGLILCNVLNKINPGAILKVVDNQVLAVHSPEGPAHSCIQYFENMKNFLDAVKDMALLTFEASDLEKVPTLFKCSLVYLIQHTILSKFTVRYIVL